MNESGPMSCLPSFQKLRLMGMYLPVGSIAGILKKMHHEVLAGLADATKDVLEIKGSSLLEAAK